MILIKLTLSEVGEWRQNKDDNDSSNVCAKLVFHCHIQDFLLCQFRVLVGGGISVLCGEGRDELFYWT